MKGLNRVTLFGRIATEIELNHLPNGTAAANFRFATPYTIKNSDGDYEDRTEFHTIQAYGPLAEVLSEHAVKGHQLYIEGFIRTRSYEDKSGNKVYKTEVVATDFIFSQRPGSGSEESEPAPKKAAKRGAKSRPAPTNEGIGDFEPDDDLPF